MSVRSTSTTSSKASNYVYVKPYGQKNAKPKRVLLPRSINTLKKSCTTSLKEKRSIITILTEGEDIVSNIDDIEPGSTIYATYIDEEFLIPQEKAQKVPIIRVDSQRSAYPKCSDDEQEYFIEEDLIVPDKGSNQARIPRYQSRRGSRRFTREEAESILSDMNASVLSNENGNSQQYQRNKDYGPAGSRMTRVVSALSRFSDSDGSNSSNDVQQIHINARDRVSVSSRNSRQSSRTSKETREENLPYAFGSRQELKIRRNAKRMARDVPRPEEDNLQPYYEAMMQQKSEEDRKKIQSYRVPSRLESSKVALYVTAPKSSQKRVNLKLLDFTDSDSSEEEKVERKIKGCLVEASSEESEDNDNDDLFEKSMSEVRFELRQKAKEERKRNTPQIHDVKPGLSDIAVILSELIKTEDIPKCLDEMCNSIPKDRSIFIDNTSDFEAQQLYNWVHSAADQSYLKRFPRQPYHDFIVDLSAETVARHRFVYNKNVLHVMRTAIVGPRRSGKSTLLAALTDQYLYELAASGQWHSTFVLAIDLKILTSLATNYKEFYRTLYSVILEAVAKQRPPLIPIVEKLRTELHSVTEYSVPVYTNHGFPDVDYICEKICKYWNDENGLDAWFAYVTMLPVLLPQALGFKNTTLMVDNLDCADIVIQPTPPFNDNNGYIILVEHIKYALTLTNFVVSCENQTNFFTTMAPFDEFGIDLMNGLDFVYSYDVKLKFGARERISYQFDIQEEPLPVSITVDTCGGIAPYLHAWDELNHAMFMADNSVHGSDEWEEYYFEAVSKAQILIDLMFICEGSPKITVLGCHKVLELEMEESSIRSGFD